MLCFLCSTAQVAYATYFRYGHISWSRGSGPNEVNFTVDQAWRRDAFGGTGADGLPVVGDTIQPDTLFFGDGTSVPIDLVVTSIDPADNWLFGRFTTSHAYAGPGIFTAFFDSCCRISANCSSGPDDHINNPDGDFRVETEVNLVDGSNGSPVSALPPIVFCPQNGLCTFQIPAVDPDGGTLNYRLSTPAESKIGNQPGPPQARNAASISPTGLYTWDTTGATLSGCGKTAYSTQVTIENVTGAGEEDKSAVDFLIRLVSCSPGNQSPVFDPPSPCDSTFSVTAGTPVNFTVQASDPDTADIVNLNVAGLPPGAIMTPPLPASGNPIMSTFSWTPTADDAGTHVMTFSASDDCGNQALCSATIQVESCTKTRYCQGLSFVKLPDTPNRGIAVMRLCVTPDYCDALRAGPGVLTINLGDCTEIIIPWPGGTSASGIAPGGVRYTLTVDCAARCLFMRLTKGNFRCVTNPVKCSVSLAQGPCVFAEETFPRVKMRATDGRIRALLRRELRGCP